MLYRNGLKHIYYGVLRLLGGDVRLVRRLQSAGALLVLNLHRVHPDPNPFWSPLSPAVFDDLVAFLKQNFRIVTFGDETAVPMKEPHAILSFDDGYYDFIEYAMPILERHGVRANMNVIGSCVEAGSPPWNIRLYDFLRAAPDSLLGEFSIPGFSMKVGSSDESKQRYGVALSRFLKNRPRPEREVLLESVAGVIAKAPGRTTRMMDVADVRAIAAHHEVGSHSYSHESMAFEPDAFFREDFERSARLFRERLDLPLRVYAFPNGSYRPEQVDWLRERGVERVLLVEETPSAPGNRVHPRITVYGATPLEARFRALGHHARPVA